MKLLQATSDIFTTLGMERFFLVSFFVVAVVVWGFFFGLVFGGFFVGFAVFFTMLLGYHIQNLYINVK